MKRISFATSDVAATPKHDCGVFHMTVSDEEAVMQVEALTTLGFTPTVVDLDPIDWSFDVTTALHDDMKGGGGYRTVRSRVTVSREAFPKWTTAAEVAGCMAVCHHGGMPIEILPRY